MELDGLGCSLVGRAVYVFCHEENHWLPWEFITSPNYVCRILITGAGVESLELESDWSFVIRPTEAGGGKEWSCLATILRAMGGGGPLLLVFGLGAPKAPPAFLSFLDGLLADGTQKGRVSVTRVWLGEHIEIPTIPDAIFFPVGVASHTMYEMIHRLPPRLNHEGFFITNENWANIVEATKEQNLGLVVSDVGEPRWSLFWHKIADSDTETSNSRFRKGLRLVKIGTGMLEHMRESAN